MGSASGKLLTERSWSVNCIKCGTYADIYHEKTIRTARDAAKYFRSIGWSKKAGFWTCESCRGK